MSLGALATLALGGVAVVALFIEAAKWAARRVIAAGFWWKFRRY